jgi:predicted transcriptional regulator
MVMQLAVDKATIIQLEQVANAKHTTPQQLAEQALREFLRNEARQQMQSEMQAFRAMHAELLTQYPGEFVAIYQGKLIDHDVDQLALYQRTQQRHPNRPVLIKPVQEDPEEVYSFRSPLLEGA